MTLPEDIQAALADYPTEVTLKDGGRVVLKPAVEGDAEAILEFARGLLEQDLLFLRVDITEPAVVANWLANVSAGETVSLLAWDEQQVVGYATLDRNSARWTRRVGEIRVNVGPQCRGQGLGRHLTGKIFDVAQGLGLKKLVAHMTTDQAGAQAAFTRLGFRIEALLTDYLEDREGQIHDLNIMSYDIDGLNAQVDAPLKI